MASSPAAAAVLNADNRWFDFLAEAARGHGAQVRAFGTRDGCAAQLTDFRLEGAGARVEARLHGRPIEFRAAPDRLALGPDEPRARS